MQQINISELKPHPRNNEFFDDITGENWESFKESIKTSGVIEPVVITKDMTIVSGHQRVRACKELGITSLLCDCRFIGDNSEDEILKALIETNIRQRGVGNPNAAKLGRCIKELERIYGIQHGNNQRTSNNFKSKTQEELANELGMTVQTLQNYKKLTELIPELEELVDTGILSPTAAAALVRQMTPEEQEKFIATMDVTKKITQKQVQEYILQNRQEQQGAERLRSENARLKDAVMELENQKRHLEEKANQNPYDKKQQLTGLTTRLKNVLEDEFAPVKIKKCVEELGDSTDAIEYLKQMLQQMSDWITEMNGYINIKRKDNSTVIDSDLPWM